MRVGEALAATLETGAGALVVAFALGIGVWFALPFEPPVWSYALAGLCACGALGQGSYKGRGLAAFLSGFLIIGLRAHLLFTPVLEAPYYGPVAGRLVSFDRGAAGQMRLTLGDVQLLRFGPDQTPKTVRIGLSRDQAGFDLRAGARLATTARLTPPEGPTEPDGFDFRRFAYFEQLGAVGSTATPVVTLEPAQGLGDLRRLQGYLAGYIRAVIKDPDAGGFVAAVLTGDRSGLSPEADQAMRDTNLYHLVSISGMHMALLGSFAFGLLRLLFGLCPPLVLRSDPRKLAAALALPICLFYLLLAGRDVATERAFIIVAVGFGAILCDRRALSLQTVALAAFVVLLARPEALLNVGFQMSFAATTALVLLMPRLTLWPKSVALLLGTAGASLIAGAATAPFAAATFGRLPQHGLWANLLAAPLMALFVMPAGLLAPLLAPLGLEALPLYLAGWGSEMMLKIAKFIATWPGAVIGIKAPPPWMIPLVSLSAACAVVWGGALRKGGIVVALGLLAFWPFASRPYALVSADGAAMGVMGPQGRAFSKPRGAGFSAATWLTRDGDLASQEEAAKRPMPLGLLRHVYGKTAVETLEDCGGAQILILSHSAPDHGFDCEVWDPPRLRAAGGIMISQEGAITPLRGGTGRLWQ